MVNSALARQPVAAQDDALPHAAGPRRHHADRQPAARDRGPPRCAVQQRCSELIAYAKKNPGKLIYGTPGAGSTTHLGTELLKREAGIDMLHSPFKGSAPAHTELMGGRIDLVADPFLSIVTLRQGRPDEDDRDHGRHARGRATTIPTVAETLPGFSVNALLGFVAPAGTPKAVLQKIQADTAAALLKRPRCASASRSSAWRSSPRGPSSSTPSSPPRCSAGSPRRHGSQDRASNRPHET